MPGKIALNVTTDTIQTIDDLDDATKFVTHKPRLPPYSLHGLNGQWWLR